MKGTGTKRLYVWIGLVVLWVLAACAADTDALQVNTPASAEVENTSSVPPAEDNTPTEETTVNNAQNNTQDEAPSDMAEPEDELSTLGFENGDPNLKATDPNAFTQAAGEPQLVELFAFW